MGISASHFGRFRYGLLWLGKRPYKSGNRGGFVVPKKYGDEDMAGSELVGANEVRIDFKEKKQQDFYRKVTYIEVGSLLIPYVSPMEFSRLTDASEHDYTDIDESVFSSTFEFSGEYGENLAKEVARYALIGSRIAEIHEHDIIHAHDWLTYPAGISAKTISGKPLIVHVHATEFDRSGESINPYVFEVEKAGMEAADKVITVSNLTRNTVIERYGIHPDKVVTIHNAVLDRETDWIATDKPIKEKIVTFLGRITFQKGPDYFVEAAHRVLQKDENVRFVMAGTGDMLHRMVRRVAELRIGHRFHFTGFLKGDEVFRMFSMSDVYVMPSVSEPFGISPLEAMRSQVPVIISKQSGVSEILNHAIKVDFWDIDAMADAIYALIHYQGISKLFIRYGKEEVENLKWDNVAALVIQEYNQLKS
jgi:glycosyltransferase involved in cell wall biosynthesis